MRGLTQPWLFHYALSQRLKLTSTTFRTTLFQSTRASCSGKKRLHLRNVLGLRNVDEECERGAGKMCAGRYRGKATFGTIDQQAQLLKQVDYTQGQR